MNSISGLIGSVIGGLVGAAIWAGITYVTHWEISYIALLVGFLAGLGAQLGAKGQEGKSLGAMAAVVAVAAILGGKYMAVHFSVQSFLNEGADEELVISWFADEVVYEKMLDGDAVRWPSGVDPDEAYEKSDYPKDVWSEARTRWKRQTSSEQEILMSAPYLANEDYLLSLLADDVVDEYEAEDKDLDWPDESSDDYRVHEGDYPDDVWAEAERQWDGWSTSEQEQYRDWAIARRDQMNASMQQQYTQYGFMQSFNLFDLLWLGLAVSVAFRVASGGSDD